MPVRWKIVALAIVPLLVATIWVGLEVSRQAARLAEKQVELIEASLMAQKRAELEHAVALVEGELEVLGDEPDRLLAARHAKALIAAAHYGVDGYFFAYDPNGTCLVHPKQPELVGRNLTRLKDSKGRPIIPRLIDTAQHGSGFQQYNWVKPSTGRPTEKLSYVALVPRFGWVLGTGVYLDDVATAAAEARAEARRIATSTMWHLAGVALLAIAVVFAGTMVLNVNEQRLADRRLRLANELLATLRQREQERVERNLHESVLQLLTATKYDFQLAQQQAVAGDAAAAATTSLGLERLDECFAEVRRIARHQSPVALDDGWSPALVRLTREFAERTGLRLELADSLGESPPPEPYQSELYRVVQECLRNIEQSAEATAVEVAVGRDDAGALFLRVTDDGRGFDPRRLDPAHTGVGLRHIRERVADLGGTVRIESRRGHTEIFARLKEDRGSWSFASWWSTIKRWCARAFPEFLRRSRDSKSQETRAP